MPDGLLITMFVEVRGQQLWIEAEMPMQEAGYICGGGVAGGQNLPAVAGGDNHALGHSWHGGQGAGGLRQMLARYGDALAQFNRRGLVIDADEDQGHWAPIPCTRLIILAAITASITRKTAPAR